MRKNSNETMAGDKADIENLMRIYGNMVLRTAYMYTKHKETAEDIFQEVFISAYKALDNFRGDAGYSTWLYKITVNKCRDYLKSAYNNKVVLLEKENEDFDYDDSAFFGTEKSAEDIFIENNEETSLKEAVFKLPKHYREVILAVYYGGLEISEAAKFLEIPEGTVKSRISRAKQALKKIVLNEHMMIMVILIYWFVRDTIH